MCCSSSDYYRRKLCIYFLEYFVFIYNKTERSCSKELVGREQKNVFVIETQYQTLRHPNTIHVQRTFKLFVQND